MKTPGSARLTTSSQNYKTLRHNLLGAVNLLGIHYCFYAKSVFMIHSLASDQGLFTCSCSYTAVPQRKQEKLIGNYKETYSKKSINVRKMKIKILTVIAV